ncbi:Cas10/Cmr2 second palm domain-containing protein [Thermobifida cellulosilytica]|uniref:Cas10/Cmr2 second palm domain-containing protein n=1 Tax=Thermobifida cellulosilytica TaxID=144786 RepID=UPI0018DD5254|nr:type III-B CRISPR-associated protein Cas10/Cmr2 [Thermobifida cellulosilytica]
MIGLSGVQRFISEARTTADLANASDIVARLARVAMDEFTADELVIPSQLGESPPNRIVALTPAGTGAQRARAAARAVHDRWEEWVRQLFGRPVEVPGFPEVFWSVAGPEAGDYLQQWEEAHVALAARKRLRGFDAPEYSGGRPCSLAPRWIAEAEPPKGIPAHQRGAQLSAAGWVKRLWHTDTRLFRSALGTDEFFSGPTGFPSTSSVASVPYRKAVLERLADPQVNDAVRRLRSAARAVMGSERFRALEAPIAALRWETGDRLAMWTARGAGWWVYPEVWQVRSLRREYAVAGHMFDEKQVDGGRKAATDLLKALGEEGPTPYYAVLASDLDNMGTFLSAEGMSVERHRQISRRLVDIARVQRAIIEELSGVAVYAGGDDLLAFLPARTALEAAERCRAAIPAEGVPTASTAVLFAHAYSSLRHTVERARSLLETAKSVRNKNALATGFVTRSGTSFHTVIPWSVGGAEGPGSLLRMFVPGRGGEGATRLSPRLVADLEREQRALTELARRSSTVKAYRAEVTRLVLRHGGSQADADALIAWGDNHYVDRDAVSALLDAARVAVFLRGEIR